MAQPATVSSWSPIAARSEGASGAVPARPAIPASTAPRPFCAEHAYVLEGYDAVCSRAPCVAKHDDIPGHHDYVRRRTAPQPRWVLRFRGLCLRRLLRLLEVPRALLPAPPLRPALSLRGLARARRDGGRLRPLLGAPHDLEQAMNRHPHVTIDDIEAARATIADGILETPVWPARALERVTHVPVLLKCEQLQRAGSFKIRGALNAVHSLSEEERARGIVAASAGNHAQGVALAARAAGITATVVMPEGAPLVKAAATEGYGARVVYFGDSLEKAARPRQRARRARGLRLHPPVRQRRHHRRPGHPWPRAAGAGPRCLRGAHPRRRRWTARRRRHRHQGAPAGGAHRGGAGRGHGRHLPLVRVRRGPQRPPRGYARRRRRRLRDRPSVPSPSSARTSMR